MPQNFNVDPYYDDFDQTKNFHRILFKPGYAVQARELTQSQTILQDQITKFADNIFKQNSPVTGGQITTNFNCYYIKLQDTYNNATIDVTQFDGALVKNSTGTVIARVLVVEAATGGDPNTLVVSYKTGTHFADDDVIYDVNSNLAAQAITSGATGQSSVVSISQGVFYVLGNFVQISPSTIILDKYDNTPTKRIGLTITETIYDYINDASLLDPAVGASNYQAPGADRYVISLSLDTRPIQFGNDQDFFELVRVVDGSVEKLVDGSVYNVIDDYFAKRDYETNGDYVVQDFKLTPKANTNPDTYDLNIGKGLAYVHGYRLENATNVQLTSNRARSTESQNNTPVFIDYGSYFYVDTVRGSTSDFFDVTTAQAIDLHCVDTANVNVTTSAAYSATVVGSGYIRNFVYDYNSTDGNANSYVFKAFVNDIQLAAPSANATAGAANTITFPTTYSKKDDAYVGVTIVITQGTSAGDTRTITAYNAATKVATVNQNWTVTPDTTSVFTLNFGIKDTEIVTYTDTSSYPASIKSHANISSSGRVGGLSTGDATLYNPDIPELLFKVGTPYVASIKNASYNTQQLTRGITFTVSGSALTATINYTGDYAGVIKHLGTPGGSLSADTIKQNFMIMVTDKSGTSLVDGQLLTWAANSGTITLSSDSRTATLSIPSANVGGSGGFSADILEKVYVSNADNTSHILKYKNLITANTDVINISGTTVATYTKVDDTSLTSTGQVYIQNAGLVTPGTKQSLYLSDVKRIVKIIDTKSSGTTPILSMLTDASYDITNNYNFDNGQRDNYYDHASITLKPGAPQPKGNILVLVDYYQHTGGDGYFCLSSYLTSVLPEDYQSIPSYTSRHGTAYSLRDSVDFRPARVNASATFQYKYNNTGDNRQGIFIPTDLSTFTTDYTYYLGRKDKLVLTKDRSFQIIEGSPSLTPLLPSEPDSSLVVANITHQPYTGYIPTEAPLGVVSDLSIEKVRHKRYTMQDIAGLEERINNIQYYTSLNLLEQKTKNLQISDAFGLNRFKNGILVDDFSSFATSDTYNEDFFVTINRRERILTATQSIKNFPLKALASVYSANKLSTSAITGLGYKIDTESYVNFFSLPYSTANVISQKFASRTVNVNPFSFSLREGVVELSPNVDNWVDTSYEPALLITDPNMTIYRASDNINLLTAGDWKAVPGTTNNKIIDRGGNWTLTGVYQDQTQESLYGAYDKINNTYAFDNNYITDISILPFIRAQQTVVRVKDMLINTPVNSFFDDLGVNNYVRKGNIIELSGVTGTFHEDDIIGYYSSGTFYPKGRILGVYQVSGSTNVRLYVAADGTSTSYTGAGTTLQSGFYTTSGSYDSTAPIATGTVVSTSHFGAQIANNTSSTSITLSPLASSANNYYNGNTIYICAGTGAGQSATISSYNGVTKVATLSSPGLTCANGDIYSIGSFTTNELGGFYGVFNIPANTFHNGQRIFRLDNSINGNKDSATTSSEGVYYAEGLQTRAQSINFGSSPSGAKNTFTRTQIQKDVLINTIFNSWDPVAQTFIVDKANYPNGLFLKSVKFFFQSKPTSDSSPITLSIIGTQNGYPNGETLDHSVVTLSPDKVNVSSTPQYLDSTTSTTFTFNVPVYIQPNVLYAFMLKSSSKEYNLWVASTGDTALSSSTKNLPTDPAPSTITKIGAAPYVGGLFVSQNSQTWSVDQNQSLMFVVDRCVFDITAAPTIQFVVPKKLPQRTLVDQSLDYYLNANSVSSSIDSVSSVSVNVDAFNITTTDFIPTTTLANYTYNATLTNGNSAGSVNVTPGKFGTPNQDDIYLSDGRGQRVLDANSNTSFSLYAQLSSTDNAVSPVISDAGLSVYGITWNINNAECSNSMISLNSGGSSYSSTPTVTVSAPTGKNGTQAYAAANVVGGVIDAVYFTNGGSGYITTPTITITDGTGSSASVVVVGETSKNGGNILAKYITKKVILAPGFDSGDMNVYLTAYRPVNTDIHVYYKILNRNDTQVFEDGSWQLMTKTNSCDSTYSLTRDDLYEYSFAPGSDGIPQNYVSYTSTNGQTYTNFSQFAIKIVMTSSDHTYTPFLTDLRALALPADVNTTV